MNIEFKRWMSALLCCAMLFGMLPVNAFATENGAETGIVLEENVVEEPTESAPSDPVLPDISSDDGAVEPVVEDPETQEPEAEEPVAEEPVEEDPAVETPEVEEPAEEDPAVEQPAADEPVQISFDVQFEQDTLNAKSPDYPEMKYYNDTNTVAYDVVNPSTNRGANDANHAYVESVTLGGKAVTQADSNGQYANGDGVTTRVGSALSNYYPGVDTNSNNSDATLVIRPAAGYYVSQIVIACCDVTVAYSCGTWKRGQTYTASFDVSTGGDLITQLPSRAFCHGTSSNHYSANGDAQYFILIKVAPVPKPLYVAYEYGNIESILGSDFSGSPFESSNEWTTESADNNYGTGGSNETKYTQFKYSYRENSEVGNWKHFSNSVTKEARLAAAAKGYYFAGWKATYYNECNSRYVFSDVYSEATELIGEGANVRLTTHVKLVAQWEPVKLTVQKVVEGLPSNLDYTINVNKKNDGEFQTATFNGAGSKVYAPITEGTYSAEETGAAQSVEVNGKKYTLTTTYSDPVTVTTEAIVAGTQQNVVLTVTNIYKEVTTFDLPVNKVWDDNNNQDGIRPGSVTVKLLADGKDTGKTLELNAGTGWTGTFTDLDKKANGNDIAYTVEEAAVPEGYEASVDDNVITNTHTPEKTEISVTKVWKDNDDQDGIRPTSVTIQLLADGKATGKTLELNAGTGWTGTFTDLDKKANGNDIAYTVEEAAVPEGYEASVDDNVITNTHTPEKTEISVTKVWKDNDDQDGLRPDSVTIQLLADGKDTGKTLTLNEGSQWTGSFAELDKFAAGEAVVYTIEEITVDGYETEITGNQDNGYTVTNSHTPETVDVSGSKIWDDNNNQDGKRPASITIKLLANGEVKETVTVTEADGWAWSFTDLPKYADGQKIEYTITEDEVAEYETTVDGFNVTNTHGIEKTTVSGQKTWNDNNNQDGKRPASITINLLADGKVIDTVTVTEADGWAWSFTDLDVYKDGVKIEYSISEDAVADYETEVNGFNVTNTHAIEKTSVSGAKTWIDNDDQDGKRPASITINLLADGEVIDTVTVTEADGWAWSFTELPKYRDGGVEIVYTVTEETVEGYETTVDGFNVTNSYTPETTKVEGSKIWNDANNQDGKRPASITINLLADGEIIETVTVGADNWSWSFTDLPKYKDHGTEIVYSVTETGIEDYSTEYDGYNVINSYTPEQTSVTVAKAWVDSNDQDGLRPESVTVKLLANGADTGKTLVLNAGNNWTGSFIELDKFAEGKEIVYTVAEVEVADYKTVITGDQTAGFTVTNTHEVETLKVSGKKTWVDNNNQDGKRPASITIHLLADGQIIQNVTVTEADGWAWNFENLPKYRDHGKEIVYTITEDAVAEYTTEISGYNVTNTHKTEKTEVDVTKVWKDNNDQDGIRPNSVTIQLLADGKATGKTLVLNVGNNWSGTFENLDKFAAGEEIAYTVAEQPATGYTAAVTGSQANGYTVTNSHTPATTSVSGSKTWNDNNNQDGARPASITINLLANGKVIETRTVTARNGWSWSFTNLPKYENHGVEITYSITENAVEDYTTTYNGYNVTNTHTPEETSVTVTKSWKDAGDQDGIRPNDVTIKLLANGKDTRKTLVLNDANSWTGSFTGLDKFAGGKEIVYNVEELTVEGYTSVITGSKAAGFTVTNTHEPETLDISGEKTWDDADDQDGKRPQSITIRLLANGVEVKNVTVSEADGWAWTFTDLPKYENHGTEITYTITEDSVEGYTATVNGFDVTNKYTPEETSVTVTKSWQDNNDQDGIRPEKITVNLLADGKKTASAELTAEGSWTYTFTELDVYAKGEKIVYTVEEEAVEGYETVINGDATKGFTVTNSHTPETLEVSGKKTWDDDNNRDGKRPASITVRLLANGKEVAAATVTADDAWAYKFTDLPKYEAGEEIVYTVTEDAVEGYSVQYSGFDITNKYTPGKTSITVTKRWIDGSNHDGIRPSSVTIYLYADDVKVAEMKLTAKDNWTGVFEDLHIYENGKAIAYTISEKSVRGYNATFTGSAEQGFTVTNTHNIIPKTGDDSNMPLYISLFGASFSALAVLMFLAKPKKKGKYAR